MHPPHAGRASAKAWARTGLGVLAAALLLAGVTGSQPADAHTRRAAAAHAEVVGAWECGQWLLVSFDLERQEPGEPALMVAVPDDGHATLQVRDRSGRWGPGGAGWVPVDVGPGSPGEGWLHVRMRELYDLAVNPDGVRVVHDGIASRFHELIEGCPA